jgi:hypothetical protein
VMENLVSKQAHRALKDVDRLTVSANRYVLIHRFDSLRQFSDNLLAVAIIPTTRERGQILVSCIPNPREIFVRKGMAVIETLTLALVAGRVASFRLFTRVAQSSDKVESLFGHVIALAC